MIPDNYKDILDKAGFAHVATLGPGGRPHSSPVWYLWDGQHLRFSLTTGRQKYRNLKRNPVLTLSILDPANPYRYLEIRGTVASIEDDPDNAFINALAKKYLGQDRYPWPQPGDHRVVVTLRPEHTTQMG